MRSNILKPGKLLLGAAIVAVASSVIWSCTLEPYIITAEEQYTRNFIKDFGLVDPNQDWNLAKAATVKVNLGDNKFSSVKIYGKHGDNFYLIADLTDISGKIDVPVDVPESCSEIMVKAGGRKYYGSLNSTIDCTDLSRGIPGSSYDDYGENPNPAVYKSTVNGYTVLVQHTTKGNGGEDSPYSKYNDGGAYQYFNTQQISPLISTTPWDTYYSANTKKWTENPNGWLGLLPESGIYNRPKEELENWLREKRAEGHSIVEDFRINTGDDGSFTLFPYYYGTNLVHELGVYLLDDKGNPLIKDAGASNTLDKFISFPVFKDRDPGDLQIQPHYDSAIDNVILKKDGNEIKYENPLTLNEGDVVNIQDYVYIVRNDTEMSYADYIKNYGSLYHSRIAYHVWVDRVYDQRDPKPITYATCTNDGVFTALHSTVLLENEMKWAQCGIPTELGSYGLGKGIVKGKQINFPYKIIGESPVKSISVSPSSVEIPVGETVTLDVTLYDKDNKELDFSTYFNELKVTDNWYPDNIAIYKDESDKKIKIEAKAVREPDENGNTSMWPQVYVGEAPGENSSNKVTCGLEVKVIPGKKIVDVNHSYSRTYTVANDAMSLATWNGYLNEEPVLVETIIMNKLSAPSGILSWWPVNIIDKSVFENVDENCSIFIEFEKDESVYMVCSEKDYSLSYKINGSDEIRSSNSLNGGTVFEILFKDADLQSLRNYGLGFKSGGNTIKNLKFRLIDLWKPDAKNEAITALESYYNTHVPTEVNCGCGETHAFSSNAIAEVEILGDAAYDKISYRVTWTYTTREEREVTKAAPRYKAPVRMTGAPASREYDATASFLNPDGTWQDVSTFWSRFLPGQEEVASYPPNVCMLARARGYDVTITYGTDENGKPKPWKGNLGVYLKVIGSYDADDSGESGTYTDYVKEGTDYVVFSQRRFNKAKDGANSDQISALSVKHPMSGRTFLTFEDMLVTHPGVTPDNYWEYSSDRDVNDLIFNITNYGSISNDDPDNEIKEEKNETIEEGFSWLWAVEDLGATDDFDFNDMVMKITSVTKNKTITPAGSDDSSTTETTTTDTDDSSTTVILYKKVTFTPLCAGGTLPLYVHYNDYILRPGVYQEKDLDYVITDAGLKDVAPGDISVLTSSDPDPSSEIHKWFGNYPHTTMINTSGGDMVRANSCVLYLNTDFTIEGFGSTSTNTSAAGGADGIGGLSVSVNDGRATQMGDITADWKEEGNSWVITPAENGKVSQMFMVHDAKAKWRWPTERTHILDVYPKFKDWVKNMSTYDTWYNKCEDSKKVIERYDLK